MTKFKGFRRGYGIGLALTIMGVAAIACGGGGGGSSPVPTGGPTPVQTATPIGTATSTPIATATPTPTSTPASANVTGQAVDENGAPVSGATVSFGTGFSFAPSGGITGTVATATTDATGHFTANVTVGSASYVQVAASGHATAHKIVTLTAGSNTLSAWTLPVPTSDEQAALAAVNSDRASLGSGAGAQALTFDADMVIVGRFRANDMAANGYFAHTAPGQSLSAVYAKWQTIPNNLSGVSVLYGLENIAAGPASLTAAESDFVYNDGASNNGHHDIVLSKGNAWVGFGEAFAGKNFVAGNGPVNYFAEVFATTCGAACP